VKKYVYKKFSERVIPGFVKTHSDIRGRVNITRLWLQFVTKPNPYAVAVLYGR
jgi:hypothetical protein